MIRNLLLNAATSPNQNQRNQSIQILNNQFTLNTIPFIDQMFNLICSQDRNDHIVSFSYMKKLIIQSQRGKLIDLNEHMQKAFMFWYQKDRNRNHFQQLFDFQRQNVIHLNALYLSLNSSARYRESFIDVVPFKICQFYTKAKTYQLHMYLNYYGNVLKQLVRYRIGNINSKKAAMGSVMLLKVTTKLNPQSSLQASLWINFSINFSKFNSWIPDKNFLIRCLVQYSITKQALMILLQYLSTNFKIVWIMQDYCKILQGLQKIMTDCQNNTSNFKCKEVETILKCLRSFLHSFFTCDTKIQNNGEAMIAQYIYSYQQFEKTSYFLMNMIDHFSFNNEHQSMGNLSQMIVQYSTQILRLYSTYLEEDVIEKYAKKFMENFHNNPNYQKLFIFFSSLPKFVLQMFEYDQGVKQIITGGIQLSQQYEPVYINYLTHYITVNEYVQIDIVNKLAQFLYTLVRNRTDQIEQFDYSSGGQVPQQITLNIERISLSIYALSKLSKYKQFVQQNGDYIPTIVNIIFDIMLKSTNDLSIIIDSVNELINRKNGQFNKLICKTALQYLIKVLQDNQKNQRLILYQIQIELYRIIKKTISIYDIFNQIQNLPNNQSSQLKSLIFITDLNQKSQSVKQQIFFLIQEILIQFNRISHHNMFPNIQHILIQFSQRFVNNLIFQQLFRILQDTTQTCPQVIIQNKMFQKTQFANEQYAIVGSGFSRQLHLTCVKTLLELSLYQKYLQMVFLVISRLNSKYLLCVWQAIQTLYPGKIQKSLIPQIVKQRLQKIRSGHLLDLFEKMDLNGQKMNMKQTPSWYELYRNILREDSVVIDIIHQKFKQY